MPNRQNLSLDHIDARAKWLAAYLFWGLSLIFWIVSALSRTTENARVGVSVRWDVPWILEGSSLITSAVLYFLVWQIHLRWPVEPGDIVRKFLAHLAGAILFSALHIVGMVVLREAYWHVLLGQDYTYLRDPVNDVIYDFRKDLVTYATIVMIISLVRNYLIAKTEQFEARQHASVANRITLKCGGKTVFLDAREIEAVKADGNYVKIYTDGECHHARLPLSEALVLLQAAGRRAERVHRSWIVDAHKIERIDKTPKGDFLFTLRSGREVRGSRRYRDVIDRLA